MNLTLTLATTQKPVETCDMTTDAIYEALSQALMHGHFGDALKFADELCRSSRAHECFDLLALPKVWPLFQAYSVEQLQGLTDRIELYNSHCEENFTRKAIAAE